MKKRYDIYIKDMFWGKTYAETLEEAVQLVRSHDILRKKDHVIVRESKLEHELESLILQAYKFEDGSYAEFKNLIRKIIIKSEDIDD